MSEQNEEYIDYSFLDNKTPQPQRRGYGAYEIRAKKLLPKAILPTKNTATDAGFDLYASDSVSLTQGVPTLISTSIALEIPEGFVGLIWPRSGLAVKYGIDTLAGVIDSGYRGEVKVCLLVHGANYEVKYGDKIAQILIQEVPRFNIVEVSALSNSERGEKGFGSSD